MPRDSGRFRELWRQIQRDYDLSELTRPENLIELEEPEEPEDNANTDQEEKIILSANRGSALIQLDFAVETPSFPERGLVPPVSASNHQKRLARPAQSAYAHGRQRHRVHQPKLSDYRPVPVGRG